MGSQKKKEFYLVLHNIRSVHNVGSIFRTAEAAGVTRIYMTGYTPRPIDRFGQPRSDVAKTALGAESQVPWEGRQDLSLLLRHLKDGGVHIYALEQDPKAVDYKNCTPPEKAALLVGNEVRGLSKNALSKADEIIEIPMKGDKESLNVSVATGVALFRLRDR